MIDGDPATGARLERAAESATLKLVARVFMVVGMPTILAIAGFIGSEVWSIVRDTGRAVDRIDKAVISATGGPGRA